MAEIIEYAFVILTSSLMVGFSMVGYSGYLGAMGVAENRVAFTRLEGMASSAIERGTSNGTLQLASASLTCTRGELALSSPAYSASTRLPVECGFSFENLNGAYSFTIGVASGYLSMVKS